MSERVSRAPVVLFVGASSRRLERAAFERAARILCRKGCPPGEALCTDCRRVFQREHPDVLVAAPEARRRANVPALEEGGGSKETTIPTSLVRAVAAEASRRPYEGAERAILLLDVDRTDPAAQSALLKVLEEPPGVARFLLTAARPRRLPDTILSRVAIERVPSASREETAAALKERGLASDEAEARAAFASGDADEAAELDLEDARATRDALLEAASGLFLSGAAGWALALADAADGGDAAETGENLTLLARLLRDAVAAASGAPVVHEERRSDLARLGRADARRLLDAARDALELAADLAESTRNARLACDALALRLL
jgi:DNA polymerase-3 subunit delta'